MPLVRDHEYFEFDPSEGVYFRMTDGAARILCKVSHEALRDRRALDGGNADLSETFVRHRLSIEAIACNKYLVGHRRNELILVLSKDLTPAGPPHRGVASPIG
jgi:uncharacterized protein DUF1488